VRLEVSNQTAVAIEFESFELNRERVVQPGQKVAVYLSGLGPGRYEFFDDFHPERKACWSSSEAGVIQTLLITWRETLEPR